MVTPTNHVIAMAGFTLREDPGTLEIFRNIFLTNMNGDQQNSYHLGIGPQALPYHGKSAIVIALRS